MDFIIQYNMLSNDLLMAVKDAVEDLPHQFVGLIPFSREITSNEPIVGLDHIPYGSTSFVETTHDLGWRGLSFDIEQFSYATAVANRDDMLNQGNILPATDMVEYLKTCDENKIIFMKPSHDLKKFSGAVFSAKEAASFLVEALVCPSSTVARSISSSTPIVAAELKNILIEWRWYIIGGKIVDGSMYRRNGQLNKVHVSDEELKDAVQSLADKWLPDSCCVMDTALLDSGETQVVEFNCINGSGFYDHDIKKIMTAWIGHYNG